LDEQISSGNQREANMRNGDIVTESESDDPDAIHSSQTPLDPGLKKLIEKRRRSIRRQAQRTKAKRIMQKNFLGRKVAKRIDTIVEKHPDIGETIERFVRDNNVGAEAWRRTGVLTFDGNVKKKQKVTYERIRKHLESVYKRKFSYGTTVELCIARNKRHRSALRYKGIAKVTTRRARKGFQLRYNPDFHWSNALYRGLDYIQHTDGTNILNVNRDDASGFRLDTLTTHKQYPSPSLLESSILSTHTDYVTRYPSVLQTSSYHFTRTGTTPEICAGVVKAVPIHDKNPGQHAADFSMLMEKEELHTAFHSPDGNPKSILCARVDGAMDEGPSHEEVQFFWTLDHLKKARIATLVTARSSGSSFLNRVELQNGCLTRGHANLFIPSTLAGNCMEGAHVNMDILKQNLELAIDIYLDRVNLCPCGDGVIQLFKGADSSLQQLQRDKLKCFLKGSKKKKEQLERTDPEVYHLFETVWKIREQHMVPGYPRQYIFFLLCCFQNDCDHPKCQQNVGKDPSSITWFPGGPSIKSIPLPVPDPNRPWSGSACIDCKGLCAGHYLEPKEALASLGAVASSPPSTVIQNAFKTGQVVEEKLAEDVLLPSHEVKLWLDHLRIVQENRKRGAAKAAETRRSKQRQASNESEEEYCGVCGDLYEEETDEVEDWIACDLCSRWFHWHCVNITTEPSSFVCISCA
jgi:hypothetical protein